MANSPNVNEVPTSTLVKTEKSDEKTLSKLAATPPQWYKINQKKQCVDGDHNAPSVHDPPQTQKQKIQKRKIGMVIGKKQGIKTSWREITIPQALSTCHPTVKVQIG